MGTQVPTYHVCIFPYRNALAISPHPPKYIYIYR